MKKLLCILLLLVIVFPVHGYTLTNHDNTIISQVSAVIDLRIQKNWESYKQKLLTQLKKIQKKQDTQSRNYALVSELLTQVSNIDVISQAEKDQQKHDDIQKQYYVSTTQLRTHWLTLYNNYRTQNNIPALNYDKRLETTWDEWAQYMLDIGKITHERTPGDGWYNYPIIEQWFQDRWVTCQVSWNTTSVENTGYHAYYCPAGWDCSQKAKQALWEIFQYYIDEKWLPYPANAHYKTTISPYLKHMGLGLAFKDEWNGWIQVYTAAHFCTEFN